MVFECLYLLKQYYWSNYFNLPHLLQVILQYVLTFEFFWLLDKAFLHLIALLEVPIAFLSFWEHFFFRLLQFIFNFLQYLLDESLDGNLSLHEPAKIFQPFFKRKIYSLIYNWWKYFCRAKKIKQYLFHYHSHHNSLHTNHLVHYHYDFLQQFHHHHSYHQNNFLNLIKYLRHIKLFFTCIILWL